MGLLPNFMEHLIFIVVFSFLSISGSTHLNSNEEGHISVLITKQGIDFAKDVLINKAVSSMIPLQLPDIEKYKKIPLLGKVRFVLSNISINSVSFDSSYVASGEDGLVIVASGATADLSMRWKYSYTSWVVVISDSGDASVQVNGMEVGISVALREQEGAIKLILMDCECHVKDISINVNGGAAWLYQALVDVFEKPIGNAIEKAITKNLQVAISKLDARLELLPKRITIGQVASLNVTFVKNPVLSNSSIELDIDGLFTAADDLFVLNHYFNDTQSSVSWSSVPEMLRILLHEDVLNSGGFAFFDTGNMHWTIDKLPDLSLLNTAGWEDFYPALFGQYPNEDMNLHVSITTAPDIKIFEEDFDATIGIDVTVNVLDGGEVLPVACVSLVISTSCAPKIQNNLLVGTLNLKNFSISLNWSKLGDLNMRLLEPVMATILETSILPYVNSRLMNGIALPIPRGFAVEDAEIQYDNPNVIVLCDIAIATQYLLSQKTLFHNQMLL